MNEGYIPLSDESILNRGNDTKENSPDNINEYVYTFFITWYYDINMQVIILSKSHEFIQKFCAGLILL